MTTGARGFPVFFFLWLTVASIVYPGSVSISGLSGEHPAIGAIENSEGLFLSAAGLAECFSATCVFSAEKRKMVLRVNASDIVLTEGNPFAVIGDSVIQLHHAPMMENGDLYVFSADIIGLFDQALPEKLLFVPDKKSIEVIKAASQALNISPAAQLPSVLEPQPATGNVIAKTAYEERKNGTLFTLFLPESTAFDYTFFKPQLNINIFKGKISSEDINQKWTTGLIQEVEAVQFSDNAQLALILSDKVKEPEVTYCPNPPRIEVTLRGENSSLEAPKPPLSEPVAAKPKIAKIRTVIIDPGHGGKDPGAVNTKPNKREKDVVLAIGNKISALLKKEAPEIQCVMTRDDDTFIALKDRILLANVRKGSIFISIHANSIKGGKEKKANVNGYAVYFLDAARDDEARAVAALENSALDYEEDRKEEAVTDLDFILKSTELNLYRNESEDFAIILEKELGRVVKEVKRNKTGVSQAGFYVLRGPEMPAVLLETAFISNPREAELLGRDDFQREVAEAVCGSILRFKEKYEGVRQ